LVDDIISRNGSYLYEMWAEYIFTLLLVITGAGVQ